jgi:proteasome lid subunit RPN8/RPN11
VVRIRKQLIDEMLAHAQRELHNECCGLLAGIGGIISRIFPAVNVAANPAKNYEIAPAEVCALMRTMRAEKIDFLGVYHSHPNGRAEPSPTDIELAYYPDVAYFIISPKVEPTVRAFFLQNGSIKELTIEILA